MEALALLDIDQEDDNLLIASSPEENESNAEEEPLLILSVSPPSPTLVSCKKKRLETLGDLQNCRGADLFSSMFVHSQPQNFFFYLNMHSIYLQVVGDVVQHMQCACN